jgi:hypothetical protein
MTRQEKIDKLETESIKAWSAYQEAIAHATDDPEPQADDVETIRGLIESWKVFQWVYKSPSLDDVNKALTALTRLSAPVDVQARAEAVVDAFNSYMHLMAGQKTELFRLIVEQFTRKG